jgi:hemoglobin
VKARAIAAATLALSLATGGCADPPIEPVRHATLYERVGGRPAIVAVVDDAVRNIAADARINARFGSAGSSHLNQSLVDLLCVRTGGPCVYRGRDMSAVHDGMNLRDDEFDALVEDVARSLDKFGVPPRERAELMAILGQMRGAIVGH